MKMTRRGLFGLIAGAIASKYATPLVKRKPVNPFRNLFNPSVDIAGQYKRLAFRKDAYSLVAREWTPIPIRDNWIDEFFEQTGRYPKIGQTINVRIPPRFIAKDGQAYEATPLTRSCFFTVNG